MHCLTSSEALVKPVAFRYNRVTVFVKQVETVFRVLRMPGFRPPKSPFTSTAHAYSDSTSCASERNLSVFGRLYNEFRSRLQLQRGEKMVYLAVNDRIQMGEPDTSKEEVLFNDSDIGDDSAVEEVVEVEKASEMEALLAGTSQDDSVFLAAANDRRFQFFL
jgi:hypothetical protein